MAGGGFVRRVRVESPIEAAAYPFTLPVVQALLRDGELALNPAVTFLVGENGSGKSTLVEAVAVAAGFNAEGGSRHFRFETRASESVLGGYLTLVRGTRKPRNGFFLRAESFYNVATEIEAIERADPGLMAAYGGVSAHERSHGESFLALAVHRFGPNGLYVLDEPEAALSVRGCMALMTRIIDLVAQGSQFVIATHSPVLLAVPRATILQIDDDGGLRRVGYDEALPVQLTRDFLAGPERYLRHLS